MSFFLRIHQQYLICTWILAISVVSALMHGPYRRVISEDHNRVILIVKYLTVHIHLMTVDIRQKSAHNSTYIFTILGCNPSFLCLSFHLFFLFSFSFLALTVIRLLLLLRLLFVGHAIEPGATLCSSFSLQFCSSFRCPPQRWWRLVSLTACA